MRAEHRDPADQIIIDKLQVPLAPEVEQRLRQELEQRQDVAFAHLTQVLVPGQQSEPSPMLFVWLNRDAMRSVRLSLKLVSNVVSRALPKEQFLDVVILNSAPELLEQVEKVGHLLVENNRDERQAALHAMHSPEVEEPEEPAPSRPWWWPFGR
jgi:hypothetical protein